MKLVLLLILGLLNFNYLLAKPIYVVSSYPAKMIISEIVGNKADIQTLVPVGTSPHTFSPKPSQIISTQKAECLFYISDDIDPWAIKIDSKQKIKLIDLIPKKNLVYFEGEHNHDHKHEDKHDHKVNKKVIDPHFWTDPLTVKALLPGLLKQLIKLNPENEEYYKKNTDNFSRQLDLINTKISKLLSKNKGENIFLFHPSFLYFLKQYNLHYAGSIETSPGKEPSTKSTMNLVRQIKNKKTKALFTEPQLPSAPIKVISEASGLKIFTLDPLGGVKGRDTYYNFLMYNANTFSRALKTK